MINLNTELRYVVECKQDFGGFEPIAAFNCESAAVRYAQSCADNAIPGFDYRVCVNKTIDITPSCKAQPIEYRR